jgi:hypothetical protein
MTALAVLNIIFGGLVILMGLFLALGVAALLYEQSRLGVLELPVARSAFAILVLASGIVGLVAGIGIFGLRPWARASSLAFAGLLIVCCALSFLLVPIIASIGTLRADDLRAIDGFNLVRLALFTAIFIAIPVIYAPILFIAFSRRTWKAVFASGPLA